MADEINLDTSFELDRTMEDDGDDKDDTKRKSRNLSEKKRRDQFNQLVNELSAMVSTNSRKMDKSTILKSTISFLKSHNEVAVRSRIHEIQEDWKPTFLSNEEFTHLILEALDGFIMVFSSSGRIFYASESITSLLGHLPSDLLNSSIYDMMFDNDRANVYNLLQNPIGSFDPIQGVFTKDNQIVFVCHLKRGSLDFRDGPSYELVQFVGYFRTNVHSQEIDNLTPNTRFGGIIDEIDTRLIFVCTGRLQTPQLIREMSVVDSSKSEFTSRHSLEWKFLFLDHRAPPIIGYLPFEVLGTSGYDYYHFDDLEKVVTCHEALMQKGEGTSCYYRFLTKGQQWIWLQTRFYITYHQWNSKPEFVVCTHRVVSYIDIIKSIQKNSQVFPEPEECYNPILEVEDSKLYLMQGNYSGGAQSSGMQNMWTKSNTKTRYTPEPSGHKSGLSKQSNALQHNSGPGSDTASISADSMGSRKSAHHAGQEREHKPYYRRTRSKNADSRIASSQMTHHGSPAPHSSQSLVHQQSMMQQPSSSGQYLDQAQYVAVSVPVQPSLGFSPQLQPLPITASTEIGILITPVQAQMQDQLQKKHEELQQMIIHQQEELRRVSEQLVMAKYGLLPPFINMPVSYNVHPPPITDVENTETYTLPAIPQRQMVDQSMQHHLNDPSEYIPMQMSQQQAQLLFSTPNQNTNLERPPQ